MKKLSSISIISLALVSAFAQSPVRSENIPTDSTASYRVDTLVLSSIDSSQFSNTNHNSPNEDYDWNQSGRKKRYKRMSTNSSSKSSRRENASNKRK